MPHQFRIALEAPSGEVWHKDDVEHASRIDKAARCFVEFIAKARNRGFYGFVTVRDNGEIIYRHGCHLRDGDTDYWNNERLQREFGRYFPDDFWDYYFPIYRKAGRPRLFEGGKRVNVYLDLESLERAERLGLGNVSEGIRIALRRARV